MLNLSGVLSSCLLKEVCNDKSLLEAVLKTAVALLDLEDSRGQAVDHLLNTAITCIKLIWHNAILAGILLSAALAKEVYQLPLDPASSHVFGDCITEISVDLRCSLQKSQVLSTWYITLYHFCCVAVPLVLIS